MILPIKAKLLVSLYLASLQLSALAATQEECRAEVLEVMQTPTVRRMPAVQRNDVAGAGNRACYNKAKYESQKDIVLELFAFKEQLTKLNSSYCGANPDLIGRGVECSKAKNEVDVKNAELSAKLNELKRGENKIRKLEARYEKLRTSRPLQNNAVELGISSRKAAVIASVKNDILESLKDPESATFRRITASPDGSIICGEVNSKNSMGGYVGYKKFISIGVGWDDFTFYEESGDSLFSAACEKQSDSSSSGASGES